jgi:hypothetical protein
MSLQIDILAGIYNLVAHKILNSSFWVSNPCFKVFPCRMLLRVADHGLI